MSLLFLPIGLFLPTFSGWLLLRTIEGKTPVLSALERLAAGFIIGLTGTMFITFLAHILGLVHLDRTGFLSVQILLTSLLAVSHLLCRQSYRRSEPSCSSADRCGSDSSGQRELDGEVRRNTTWPRWACILLTLLLLWTLLKFLAAAITFLFLTPLYVDDAMDNWNLRGKVFFVDQELTLTLPSNSQEASPSSVSTYPPTVPLVKTWLATLAGTWNEPLVNGIHALWYLALLALLFGTLRVTVGLGWGFLALYLFGSLPLPLLHATNPYADMFLSAHIGAAACFLLRALWYPERAKSLRFLLLSSLPIALLPFTKNEGLLLYFPPLVFALTLSLFHLTHRGIFHRSDALHVFLWTLFIASFVLLPWLLFKWSHHLTFGNAKSVTSFWPLSWNSESLHAILVNTFFEGNWLLLFWLFFPLLLWQWRSVLRFPLLPLSASFLLPYLVQITLYTFTPLAIEAIKQTGYARGLLHLLPIVILLTVLLLHRTLSNVPPEDTR